MSDRDRGVQRAAGSSRSARRREIYERPATRVRRRLRRHLQPADRRGRPRPARRGRRVQRPPGEASASDRARRRRRAGRRAPAAAGTVARGRLRRARPPARRRPRRRRRADRPRADTRPATHAAPRRGDRVRLAWRPRTPTGCPSPARRRSRARRRRRATTGRHAGDDRRRTDACRSALGAGGSRRSPRCTALAACGLRLGCVELGCGGGSGRRRTSRAAADVPPAQSLGAGEGEVNLVAWAGLRRGRHQRPDGRLGHAVREADRLQGQRQGRRHLRRDGQPDEDRPVRRVSASGDASLRLIDAGDVAPVNTDLVPNYADVFAVPQGPAVELGRTAQMYGIPHGWGANLLM